MHVSFCESIILFYDIVLFKQWVWRVYKLLVNIYIRIKHNVFRNVLFHVAVDYTEMGIADIGFISETNGMQTQQQL